MLVLTRKQHEQLVIRLGDQIVMVRVLSVARDRVRLGITADRSVEVHREEVARRIPELQLDLEKLIEDGVAH